MFEAIGHGPQGAQKDCPARPQASRNRRRTLVGYVEDFDKPRTQLAGFFSILSPWDDGLGPRHHFAVGADLGGGGLTA
jgi:hypothetical protein